MKKLTDILKETGIELGKIYTDKDRTPFKTPNQIKEDKAGDYEKLRKNFEKTYKAYWDAVKDFQLVLKKQGKKKEEMMIHRKYVKEVLGFHSWMRQWIRKVF